MKIIAIQAMAVLHLVIVLSVTFVFSLSPLPAASATADDGKPLLQFVSKHKDSSSSLENTTLAQGESVIVPMEAVPSSGYEIQAVNLEVRDVPPNVYSRIDWNSYPIFADDGSDRSYKTDYQVKVYVDSNAEAGEYTLNIVGTNGVAKNLATSEDVQITNETFGTLDLMVIPSDSEIKMDVGDPEYQSKQLCVEDDSSPGDGTMCIGFVGKEEFPLTISSRSNASRNEIIKLSASDIPDGAWAKFVPANMKLDGSVNGEQSSANGKLILAGAVRPFGSFPPDTFVVLVQASDGTSSTVTNYLPVVRTTNMTVLHLPEKIGFPMPITQNVNGTNFTYAGVVYDPYDNNSSSHSLPVSLSIKGIAKQEGGTISPLPDWIKVELPSSSFVLKASESYYFLVKATTHMAPVGSYYLAIDESFSGNDHFTGYVLLDVIEPMYAGPALASPAHGESDLLPPPSHPAAEYPVLPKVDSYIKSPLQLPANLTTIQTIPIELSVHNGNNYTLDDVEIGQFYTAVTGFTLENASRINTLAANETGTIHGILTASDQKKTNQTSSQSHIFWTVTAANDSGEKMESTLFLRQMDIVAVPEFGSTISLFLIAVTTLVTIITTKLSKIK